MISLSKEEWGRGTQWDLVSWSELAQVDASTSLSTSIQMEIFSLQSDIHQVMKKDIWAADRGLRVMSN